MGIPGIIQEPHSALGPGWRTLGAACGYYTGHPPSPLGSSNDKSAPPPIKTFSRAMESKLQANCETRLTPRSLSRRWAGHAVRSLGVSLPGKTQQFGRREMNFKYEFPGFPGGLRGRESFSPPPLEQMARSAPQQERDALPDPAYLTPRKRVHRSTCRQTRLNLTIKGLVRAVHDSLRRMLRA